MKTENMFKYGVTPKEGKNAGRRYRVEAIKEDRIETREWDTDRFGPIMKHDTYKLWEPKRNLFESRALVTWGALKAAMEECKLPDDTKFYAQTVFGAVRANARIENTEDEQVILMY